MFIGWFENPDKCPLEFFYALSVVHQNYICIRYDTILGI